MKSVIKTHWKNQREKDLFSCTAIYADSTSFLSQLVGRGRTGSVRFSGYDVCVSHHRRPSVNLWIRDENCITSNGRVSPGKSGLVRVFSVGLVISLRRVWCCTKQRNIYNLFWVRSARELTDTNKTRLGIWTLDVAVGRYLWMLWRT